MIPHGITIYIQLSMYMYYVYYNRKSGIWQLLILYSGTIKDGD